MSQYEETVLTPEVNVINLFRYLIRVDTEGITFVDSEAEAKLVVDSLAASEVKRLEDDWTRAFRRDQPDGKKVTVSTQAIGRVVDGSVIVASTIDYVVIPRARVLKGRHEREEINNIKYNYGAYTAIDDYDDTDSYQ